MCGKLVACKALPRTAAHCHALTCTSTRPSVRGYAGDGQCFFFTLHFQKMAFLCMHAEYSGQYHRAAAGPGDSLLEDDLVTAQQLIAMLTCATAVIRTAFTVIGRVQAYVCELLLWR